MINWTNEPPSTLPDYDQTKEKQQTVCTFTFETLKQENHVASHAIENRSDYLISPFTPRWSS